MDIENLAEIYKKKLDTGANKGGILASFYWSAFNLEFNQKDIILFNRLVKMYGKDIVFASILDIYGMGSVDLTDVYGILSYFCKKRFLENKPTHIQIPVEEINKRIEKAKGKGKKYLEDYKDEF